MGEINVDSVVWDLDKNGIFRKSFFRILVRKLQNLFKKIILVLTLNFLIKFLLEMLQKPFQQ